MPTPRLLPDPRRTLVALAAVALLVGCKKTTAVAPVVASALTIVQGGSQSVQAGKELPLPVVVRVTDVTGAAMAGLPVTVVVSEGGGSVTPPSGTSDAKGEYTMKWTLGPTFPLNRLLVKVPGLDAIKIDAIGILPSDIIVAQGNSQSAKNGATLPTSIVVRVVGSGNVPMTGITVLFQVTGGGGSLSPQTIVTNSLGEAITKWTLGPNVGTQTAIATASVLTPVVLTATATP